MFHFISIVHVMMGECGIHTWLLVNNHIYEQCRAAPLKNLLNHDIICVIKIISRDGGEGPEL